MIRKSILFLPVCNVASSDKLRESIFQEGGDNKKIRLPSGSNLS
jgi:hypothetical protein